MPVDVYDTHGISASAWKSMRRECGYEADKAVAAAKPGPIRAMDWGKIFDTCLELRGAKHLGTTDDFPDAKELN
ncbi:hypothetical protein AB4072_01925 [Microvirga sp. 2MCAF38]|uniref:hypothetical protein n=1 Tax=Microvirga sp. 2MCAF38 TaxID=3232989 RepID=UPI003F97FCA3